MVKTYPVENRLIGALVSNAYFLGDVKRRIGVESFASPENRKIYRELLDMYSAGLDINEYAISARCRSAHFIDNILPNVTGLLTCGEVEALADNLYLANEMRKASECGQVMSQKASAGDIAGALEAAQNYVDNADDIADDKTRSVAEVVDEYTKTLHEREEMRAQGKVLRVPTSFPTLDSICYGGFAPGDLVVLAARPSVGKTSIALQIARRAASQGIPALVISLEMTNEDLVEKLALSSSDINGTDIAKGVINWDAYEESTGTFKGLPLYLNDDSSALRDIVDAVLKYNHQGKCGIAIIDYLGLIQSTDSRASLNVQISEMTRRLKRLAKECRIPVVLLSQLNRDMSKEGRAPQLHDLRDSGSIEQDADRVLMLERELSGDPAISRTINMYIRKNRKGRVGDCIKIIADDTFQNFYEQVPASQYAGSYDDGGAKIHTDNNDEDLPFGTY